MIESLVCFTHTLDSSTVWKTFHTHGEHRLLFLFHGYLLNDDGGLAYRIYPFLCAGLLFRSGSFIRFSKCIDSYGSFISLMYSCPYSWTVTLTSPSSNFGSSASRRAARVRDCCSLRTIFSMRGDIILSISCSSSSLGTRTVASLKW